LVHDSGLSALNICTSVVLERLGECRLLGLRQLLLESGECLRRIDADGKNRVGEPWRQQPDPFCRFHIAQRRDGSCAQ
jgi:hypothetical protein